MSPLKFVKSCLFTSIDPNFFGEDPKHFDCRYLPSISPVNKLELFLRADLKFAVVVLKPSWGLMVLIDMHIALLTAG